MMKKIEISNNEAKYILENVRLPKNCQNTLRKNILGKRIIFLDERSSYLLRELCGLQLQVDGFDKNDLPTSKGLMLEDLIDKLYWD